MALDDRDAKFEKALARHLHDIAQREACPDAEMLAAYHEHTLSPVELNTWKQHIAACARCQDVLAKLEITEEVPLDWGQLEHTRQPQRAASLVSRTEPEPSGEREKALQSATVQAINARKDAGAAGAARSRNFLRWVVPAGAIAAGLLLWVSVRERKTLDSGTTPAIQIAQNRTEPQVVPDEATPQQSPSEARRDQQTSKLAPPAASAKPSISIASGKTAAASPRIVAPLADGERVRNQGAYDYQAPARERIAADGQALDKNVQDTDRQQPPLDAVQEQKKMETAPAAAPPPPQSSAAGIVAENAAPEVDAKRRAASAGAAVSQTVEVTSSYSGKSALRREAAQNANLVLDTDGKSVWRLGPAGVIEYSPNGGRKWTPQASGVTADLVAGSAPSKKICWIVGRAGTILLTSDAGATWKPLASPIADDLGGIQAADALHATIWDVPNARRYETSDAGITWRSAPSQ